MNDLTHYTDLTGTERDIIRTITKLQLRQEELPSGEAVASRINSNCPDGFSKSQVYRVMDKLAEHGLIFKHDSDTDQRAFETGITSDGAEILSDLGDEYSGLMPLSGIKTSGDMSDRGRRDRSKLPNKLARTDGGGGYNHE